MKKVFLSVALTSLVMCATSCGSGSSSDAESDSIAAAKAADDAIEVPAEATVTVVDTVFTDGDLADYVDLVSGDYKVTSDKEFKQIRVVLYATPKAQLNESFEISGDGKLYLLDESGNELTRLYPTWNDDEKNLVEALNTGKLGGKFEMTYTCRADNNAELAGWMEKAKTVKAGAINKKSAKSSSSSSSSSDDDSSSSSTTSYSSSVEGVDDAAVEAFINSAGFKKFEENACSGDIDKMIEALEWLNSTESSLKSSVRNLDPTAIAKTVKLDEVSHKAGDKQDAYSLSGALNNMQKKMSSSQQGKYNSAVAKSVVYFSMKDYDQRAKYDEIYKKLR